jgi:uncharacterized protein (TIRG00374 family)
VTKADDQGARSPWRRRARPISLVARVLAFAAVFHFLVLPQIGGTRRALGLLADLDPVLLVVAVGLEGLALVAYGQLSRSLLPHDSRPSPWHMFRIVLASLSVNHVVPGGAAAGGVLQYRLLTRAGVDPAQASFAMATQSLGSALVLNLLLWVGLLVSIPATGFQPLYATAAAVGAVLLAVAAGAVLALTRGRDASLRWICRVADRIPRLDPDRITAGFVRAAEHLSTFTARPHLAAKAVGWAAANWLLDMAVVWVFLDAFGFRSSLAGLLVAYGLANVLAAIPLSPGGLGIVEATLIVTLVAFGAPRAAASLGVATYRLVQFWLPIPVGAAAWASLAGTRRRGAIEAMTDEARAAAAP